MLYLSVDIKILNVYKIFLCKILLNNVAQGGLHMCEVGWLKSKGCIIKKMLTKDTVFRICLQYLRSYSESTIGMLKGFKS